MNPSLLLLLVVLALLLALGFVLITDGRYFGKPIVFWVYDRLGPLIFGAAHEADRWYGLMAELALRGDESVLDVGTAMGDLPLTLAAWPDFNGRIVALDWSPRMIAAAQGIARRRGLAARVTFQVHDARRSLPFTEASFDLVFCFGLLEAWAHPEHILAELGRVCTPTGRLVLSLYHGTPLQPATLDLDWYRAELAALGFGQLRVAPLRAQHDVVIAGRGV